VDTVDHELLEVMGEAGCIELKFGVESGSERILRAMGKNISCNQIRQAIILAHSIGIKVKIFLVHGFPGEDLASTKETISLLKEIKPMVERVSLFRFAPLPGSHVFRNAEAFGLNIPEHVQDWSKFHIYLNNHHWWGSSQDFKQMEDAYLELEKFINDNWQEKL
jgi:coproporphyrinogen III oxidase-like Fe-S oxidoreductase